MAHLRIVELEARGDCLPVEPLVRRVKRAVVREGLVSTASPFAVLLNAHPLRRRRVAYEGREPHSESVGVMKHGS